MKTRYFKLSESDNNVIAIIRDRGNWDKNIKIVFKALIDEWDDADIIFDCPDFSKIGANKGIAFKVSFSEGYIATIWLEETWVY